MKEILTNKQQEIYQYLRDVQREGRPAPSISEISRHFGFRSSRSARDHLKALERKGMIHRDANKARAIRVREDDRLKTSVSSIALLGSIVAGYPEIMEQAIERLVHLDTQLLGFTPTSHCFALHVTGDSMIGKGIFPGDIVVVDGEKIPQEGDIVVALIDRETTLKTLVLREDRSYLQPENNHYPDLIPVNELVIQGVVRTVIRNIC